jgi:hypothetical protein
MENEEVVMQTLEQVQELQERLQEVLEDQSPPHDLRYRTDSRLFLRSGTCKTLVNSTTLTLFPLMTGLNTTVPTPTEYTMLLSASLIGTCLGA